MMFIAVMIFHLCNDFITTVNFLFEIFYESSSQGLIFISVIIFLHVDQIWFHQKWKWQKNLIAIRTMFLFFLSFAAKQPLVYLNLEFCDKYIDMVFRNWVQFSFFILFQIKFLFVHQSSIGSTPWLLKLSVEIVCSLFAS